MKKEELHIYEVYVKSPYGETVLCRTAAHALAKKAYCSNRNARLRIDGVEQTISDASRMMRNSYGRNAIIPKYKAPKNTDIHQLKPAE